MTNKRSGFWIRFIARISDLIIVSAIAVASAFLMMSDKGGWHFIDPWMYYVWTIEFITLTALWFIIVPAIWNKTLFMWVFRIEIEFENENKLLSMLKREIFFALNWIFMTMFIAIVINHTLINTYARTNQSGIKYTDWEQIRIGIVTAVGTVFMVMQFIYAISIVVRGSKKGIHDTQSETWTIWSNKYTKNKPKKINKEVVIKPRPINNNPVIWIE